MLLQFAKARAILFRQITATRSSLKSGSHQGEDPMIRNTETSGQDLHSRCMLVSLRDIHRRTRVRYLWIEIRAI